MSSNKPTILFVSPSPQDLKALADLLQDHSNVAFATSGTQALAVAAEMKSLDMVVIDGKLGQDVLYDTCTRLRTEQPLKAMPVVLVVDDGAIDGKAIRAGAADVITRSTPVELAVARIKAQLELKYKTDLLTDIALLDGLTSIPNRDRFEEYLDIEWRRSLREFNTLSLIAIDIDDFTAYNDRNGVGVGDECLKRIARVLQHNCLRAADMVARAGGDEFVALLPGISLDNALIVAQKMVKAVAALNIPHEGSEPFGIITVSAGVASIEPSQDNNAGDLSDEAEEMLYRAQQSGRNQALGIAL